MVSVIPLRPEDQNMSGSLAGVYTARRKDNTIYYRASLTYRNKHISLGSYDTEEMGNTAYLEATALLNDSACGIEQYNEAGHTLSFEKWVILVNFRDNGVYIPNPIYVRPRLFYYYFAPDDFFIFSREDLFYYSAHKIQRRGGHFFVADYGSQLNIMSRYGIKSHAVAGRDYVFLNGNPQDMQYSNIKVINTYLGVSADGRGKYSVKIHVNGYLKAGVYDDAVTAAIAYNKAADILKENGVKKQYGANYIDGISPKAYADIYTGIKISDRIKGYRPDK